MVRLCNWFKMYLSNIWWGLGNIAWGLDTLANVTIFFGDRETVSAHLGRLRTKSRAANFACKVLDIADPGDLNHCKKSKEYWNDVRNIGGTRDDSD